MERCSAERNVARCGFAVKGNRQANHSGHPGRGVFPASLLKGSGQRLCFVWQDTATMVAWIYQVSNEPDECGVTRLGMCHEMAISLSDIFQAT